MRLSSAPGRAQALLVEEAYRPDCVREGDEIVTLPAIQTVLRSQVALAIKGNCAAQRSVIEAVQAMTAMSWALTATTWIAPYQ